MSQCFLATPPCTCWPLTSRGAPGPSQEPHPYCHFSWSGNCNCILPCACVRQLVSVRFSLKVKEHAQDIKNIKSTNYVSSGFISILFLFLGTERWTTGRRCNHLFNYREGRKRGENGEQPTPGILSYPTDHLHQFCKHTPHSRYASHT